MKQMTKEQQVALIRDLLNTTGHYLLRRLNSGDVPKEWGALKLRQWAADSFLSQAPKMSKDNQKDYERERKEHNL